MTQTNPERQAQIAGLGKRMPWYRRLVADVLYVSKRDRKWWMLPLIILLLAFGALMILSSTGAAPFIYTLF